MKTCKEMIKEMTGVPFWVLVAGVGVINIGVAVGLVLLIVWTVRQFTGTQ